MPGSGPVSNDPACRPYDFDAMMHDATKVTHAPAIPSNVHLDTTPPDVAGDGVPIVGGALDTAADVAALAAEGGSGAATAFGFATTGPAIALGLGLAEIAHEDAVGRRNAIIHDRDVLQGALAAMEGRADEPQVRARRQTSPGFDEGFRRVDQFNREHPAQCERMLAAVQASVAAGTQAVLFGRDSGPEFDCRYQQDVVFHHAVDQARSDRAHDPDAFARDHSLSASVARHRAAPARG